jgi:hypothetical protein
MPRIRSPAFFPLLAVMLVVAATAGAEEPIIAEHAPEEVEELLEGSPLRSITRGDPLRAEVVALVEAPVEELAAIVQDYDTATEWAPALGECRITGAEGDAMLVRGTTLLPWPITDRTWQMRSYWGYRDVAGVNAYVQAWDYVEGSGNIEDSFGYWLIAPWPQDPRLSYVKYVVNADPGIAIPDFIIAWVTRNALPDLIARLRDRHAEVYGG